MCRAFGSWAELLVFSVPLVLSWPVVGRGPLMTAAEVLVAGVAGV
ncbi:hypothetical protein Ae406Ps2_6189c [Pseudonocardia sp. Ae406_Ps2]|nr:hypothetical protein Ae150APs1_6039 [Pseudonocardia sp. Ae150A_Ps1]OLL70641.1 hypothetical protein Ae168Ps1_6106 [Pseudonocardia sp. Ae168_Ps1]OLL70782.1 hypothetical protein Ae263Ps1_6196 [Pseudonocardia sp. Ae263_Ps1]OLL89341.1 hypothetical protein Ae356Ps1_6085 [Pseudonocardia sp. Ae356_Ps1]OLL90034.1 hypothetical protein Ae406Ps2_6189c [Pseudonocardia sp. Ae406_Ps2]OLM09793.1 hypothetical protein Ae706Ps2_6255c [Pseudonocardia sp. Ae706_Ps2]